MLDYIGAVIVDVDVMFGMTSSSSKSFARMWVKRGNSVIFSTLYFTEFKPSVYIRLEEVFNSMYLQRESYSALVDSHYVLFKHEQDCFIRYKTRGDSRVSYI